MKTITHCKTLILGGSAFACGMAYRSPKEILILERGILLIPEFASSLHSIVLSAPRTDAGKHICRDLEKRQISTGGKFHPPPVSDYFVHFTAQEKCRLLLNCEAVEVESTGDSRLVTIFGIDGLSRIQADRIIDTTPEGWQNSGMEYIRGKALCAAICGKVTNPPVDGELKCAAFIAGILPNEHLLRVDVPGDATWHEARLRLHDIWRHLQKRNPQLSIGGEASSMVYEYEGPIRKTMSNGIIWNPSAQYSDLITAFEEGYQCNLV